MRRLCFNEESLPKVSGILSVALAALYPLTLDEIYYSVNSLNVHTFVAWEEFLQRFKVRITLKEYPSPASSTNLSTKFSALPLSVAVRIPGQTYGQHLHVLPPVLQRMVDQAGRNGEQ